MATLDLSLFAHHMEYDISTSTEIPDGYKVLALARQRIETAVQSGALGDGVSIIKDITHLIDILP
jgi:hypothetical protein